MPVQRAWKWARPSLSIFTCVVYTFSKLFPSKTASDLLIPGNLMNPKKVNFPEKNAFDNGSAMDVSTFAANLDSQK